jgi:hypothetical protein
MYDTNIPIKSTNKVYTHVVDKVVFGENFIEVHKKRTTNSGCSADTVLIPKISPEEFDQLLQNRMGCSLETFTSYSFTSSTKLFDEALFELLYDQRSITPDNIEDRIIVPALNIVQHLNTNTFKYQTIDKYWDNCIDKKLLFKQTNREFNNFYDVTGWCAHINNKLTDVVLEPIPEDNPYIDIKPKGSSYWYLKLTHQSGTVTYAICGFGHNFISYK